jgi:hypothetical protein
VGIEAARTCAASILEEGTGIVQLGLCLDDHLQRENQSFLQMRTVTTEGSLLCVPTKSSARWLNLKRRPDVQL